MSEFSHLDEQGNARMVDVSQKQDTERIAIAQAKAVSYTHLTLPTTERV